MWWWLAVAQAADVPKVELTLAEALDKLVTDAPAYQQAQAKAESVRGLARQSAAAWLPILVAGGSYTRNDNEVVLDFGEAFSPLQALFEQLAPLFPEGTEPPQFGDAEPVVIQPLDVWNASATARVPLFAPSAWAETKAARRAADGAEAGVEEARHALEVALVSAAAQVEAADGFVGVAEQALTVAEARLASTKIAVEVGTATRVDLLGVEAEVAEQRSALVQARANLAKAEEALGGLLGIDGPARVILPDGEPPEAAILERPALTAAEAQLKSAKSRVAAAWWRHLPTVSAQATGLVATVPFPTGNEWAYRVGLEASWTLYDGGLRYGRLHQARADVAAAAAFQREEELRVSSELRQAERDLEVGREKLRLAEERAELANEAASVARRGLEAGTITPLQAKDVEKDAFAANVGVVAARAQLRIALATWQRTRGQHAGW